MDENIPTLDFAGWLLYCREDLPAAYAYQIVKSLDTQRKMIESLFQPGQGLTGGIVLAEMCRDTEIPLHPGAARYYEEKRRSPEDRSAISGRPADAPAVESSTSPEWCFQRGPIKARST